MKVVQILSVRPTNWKGQTLKCDEFGHLISITLHTTLVTGNSKLNFLWSKYDEYHYSTQNMMNITIRQKIYIFDPSIQSEKEKLFASVSAFHPSLQVSWLWPWPSCLSRQRTQTINSGGLGLGLLPGARQPAARPRAGFFTNQNHNLYCGYRSNCRGAVSVWTGFKPVKIQIWNLKKKSKKFLILPVA
jgi:hypothetical protein